MGTPSTAGYMYQLLARQLATAQSQKEPWVNTIGNLVATNDISPTAVIVPRGTTPGA